VPRPAVKLTHAICNLVAEGLADGLTYKEIADKHSAIPDEHWIRDMLNRYPAFRKQIDIVRRLLGDAQAAVKARKTARRAAKRGLSDVCMQAFDPMIADAVAQHVASGETLDDVARRANYPNRAVMRHWLATVPEFERMIWDARRERAQQLADEMIAIADDMRIDPQSRRVMVDTRKWLVAKLVKQYNDKLTVAGDDQNPLAMVLGAIDGKTLGTPNG